MMHAVFLKALRADLTGAWPNHLVNPTRGPLYPQGGNRGGRGVTRHELRSNEDRFPHWPQPYSSSSCNRLTNLTNQQVLFDGCKLPLWKTPADGVEFQFIF